MLPGQLVVDDRGNAFSVVSLDPDGLTLRSVVTKQEYSGVDINAVRKIPGRERS